MQIQLLRSQYDFMQLNCTYPAFIGGMGCVREDTEVLTLNGYKPISEIKYGELVVSYDYNKHKYVLSYSSGGFAKEKDIMYQVVTDSGEFYCSSKHKVGHSYKHFSQLSELEVGRCIGKCDLRGVDISKLEISIDHLQASDYFISVAMRTTKDMSLHKHLVQLDDFHIKPIEHFHILDLYKHDLDVNKILSKSALSEQWVWDIHVAGTNNYITRDGTIHHNSGKTYTLIESAVLDAREGGSDSKIYIYAPNYDLLKQTHWYRMLEYLELRKIRHLPKVKEFKIVTHDGNIGDFYFKSMDSPNTIVAYEAFRQHIDEMDTLNLSHATESWNKIVARCRQIPKTYRKMTNRPVNQTSVYTTPEGFNFVYRKWVDEVTKDPKKAVKYKMVQTSTRHNTFLPEDYIENLLTSYPANLVDAYIDGQFVNMATGSVYRDYDRVLNRSNEVVEDTDTRLFIGMDFNVGKMGATVVVYRDGGVPHVVDEFDGIFDTREMIVRIQERYWVSTPDGYKKTRSIIVFPDASSDSRKTNNASQTDLALLWQAGFDVRAFNKNPLVRDRVNSLNAMICNSKGERKLFINDRTCPVLSSCLEKQAYNEKGEPDKKAGFDHLNDALSYYVYSMYPLDSSDVKEYKVRSSW